MTVGSPFAGFGVVVLALGPITTDMLVVFAVIAVALVLFIAQPIPIDTTAIAVLVVLILLEPWTGVTPAEGVSGFANPATITVLAMFILSEGVRKTGAVQLLTRRVSAYTGTSETKQLLAVVGLAGPPAGFVNNTPVVAILIPAVNELAKKANTSPSKLLMPLSFAAMMGGTLTLIGTSTNLLASDIWARQGVPGAEPFGMFEFTQLGIVVLAVGTLYLLTVGRYLTPARIEPGGDPTEEFGMSGYLTEVVVRDESPLVDMPVRDIPDEHAIEMDVLQIVRDGRSITETLPTERVQADDVLAIRADQDALKEVLEEEHLDLLPEVIEEFDDAESARIDRAVATDLGVDRDVSDDGPAVDADASEQEVTMTEVVLLPGSWLSGRSVRISDFERRYDVTVLALRHGEELIRRRMSEARLRPGDALLLQTTETALERLHTDRRLVISGERQWESFDRGKIPVALGIVAGVVGLAALDLVPIMVSALAGMVAMIFTGCLRPADAYDAVSWDVIFLLAGVIPLGIAMQNSGAADFLGEAIVAGGGGLPPLLLLGVFYLFTALLTNLISNNASVVLMIPIAIDAAVTLDANPFAFVLAVTFAASTAFMTPIGYQTNLMVYAPGGYRFADFARVGLPLQLLLTIVTPLGIAFFWGV
jgi:di/tricarboxylate transporter